MKNRKNFIFFNFSMLRTMKSTQQLRIHQFLTRVPKPKQHCPYSFANDLVKKLSSKTAKEIVKKDLNKSEIVRILPNFSISSPMYQEIKTNSNFLEKKVMKIQKQLFERVNPTKNHMSFNDYSVIPKKYMIDSISNNNETVEILEKAKKLKKSANSFAIEENSKKLRNSTLESRRYIMTSPSHANNIRLNTDESLKTTIREKEIINVHLKKYFRKKLNKCYKLI